MSCARRRSEEREAYAAMHIYVYVYQCLFKEAASSGRRRPQRMSSRRERESVHLYLLKLSSARPRNVAYGVELKLSWH